MLLSKGEQYQIRHALKLGLEYETSVTMLPHGTLTIAVKRAPSVWSCTGIAQVRWVKGGKLDQQWQNSITGVREAIERGPFWTWGKGASS